MSVTVEAVTAGGGPKVQVSRFVKQNPESIKIYGKRQREPIEGITLTVAEAEALLKKLPEAIRALKAGEYSRQPVDISA